MRLLKKVGLSLMLILLVGCGNNNPTANYEKLTITKDTISSYILDLRISGTHDGVSINEIVKVTNYNDKGYKIVKRLPATLESNKNHTVNEEITYIKNDKVYVIGEDGKYIITDKPVAYSNPNIYLSGLKNTVSLEKEKSEKIGTKTYISYKALFKKEIINDILKDTFINLTVDKDVAGTVIKDGENRVYRIIYKLNNITIDANYYSYNAVTSIDFPGEIK